MIGEAFDRSASYTLRASRSFPNATFRLDRLRRLD